MKTAASAGRIETSENYTKHPRQTAQNLVQKSLFRGIHYLVTKDHLLFHKIQQQKGVKYWDIKPLLKEIKLQIHHFSFLLKTTPQCLLTVHISLKLLNLVNCHRILLRKLFTTKAISLNSISTSKPICH